MDSIIDIDSRQAVVKKQNYVSKLINENEKNNYFSNVNINGSESFISKL